MESIFISGYLKRVAATKSVLCPRLNPPQCLPSTYHYLKAGNYFLCAKEYASAIIEIMARMVPAVEFQKISYSKLGAEGKKLMKRLIEHAQYLNLYVILDIASDKVDREEGVAEAFDEYGVDACIFWPTPEFSISKFRWKRWLERGHLPIFAGPRLNSVNQDSEKLTWEICCDEAARLVSRWNAEVKKNHRFANVGCLIKPKEAVWCREIVGDEVFFLIPVSGEVGNDEFEKLLKGLINKQQQPMGAIDIAIDWEDKENKKLPEEKLLKLVAKAVQATNTKVNNIIERKFVNNIFSG